MEIQHYQKTRDKVEEKPSEEKPKQEGCQQANKQTSVNIASSPPSAASSPAHEFSFTISLHQPPAATTNIHHDNTSANSKPPPPNSFAVDLSPADEIFFHGHLLPLHLLSHLPVSPRSSTNSLDSFTLPITELLHSQNPTENVTNSENTTYDHENSDISEIKGRVKSKSFSLFGRSKWRKGSEVRDPKEDRERHKKKLRGFDVSDVLKRYMGMVRPLLMSFRGRRISSLNRQFHHHHHHQPYSFSSGSLSSRGSKQDLRGIRRGELFSAPASMRTSPTNSGLLLATGALATSTSDSTMEELQAAIQAAITHCKNSIAIEEKITKCQD